MPIRRCAMLFLSRRVCRLFPGDRGGGARGGIGGFRGTGRGMRSWVGSTLGVLVFVAGILLPVRAEVKTEALEGSQAAPYLEAFDRYYDLLVDESLPFSAPRGSSLTVYREGSPLCPDKPEIRIDSETTNTLELPFPPRPRPLAGNPFARPSSYVDVARYSCVEMRMALEGSLIGFSNRYLNDLRGEGDVPREEVLRAFGIGPGDYLTSMSLLNRAASILARLDPEIEKYRALFTYSTYSDVTGAIPVNYYAFVKTSWQNPKDAQEVSMGLNAFDGSLTELIVRQELREDLLDWKWSSLQNGFYSLRMRYVHGNSGSRAIEVRLEEFREPIPWHRRILR